MEKIMHLMVARRHRVKLSGPAYRVQPIGSRGYRETLVVRTQFVPARVFDSRHVFAPFTWREVVDPLFELTSTY